MTYIESLQVFGVAVMLQFFIFYFSKSKVSKATYVVATFFLYGLTIFLVNGVQYLKGFIYVIR